MKPFSASSLSRICVGALACSVIDTAAFAQTVGRASGAGLHRNSSGGSDHAAMGDTGRAADKADRKNEDDDKALRSQFLSGLLKKPDKAQADGVADQFSTDLETFFASAQLAQDLVESSVTHLFAAVGEKELVQVIHDRREAANSMAESKEKDAVLKKIKADEFAALNSINADETADRLTKEKNKTKLSEVRNGLFNLSLGLLKDRDVYDQGKNIIKQIEANPIQAMKLISKLAKIKTAVLSIGSQIKSTPTLISNMHKLAVVAKVKNLPKTARERPKKSAIGL